MEEEEEEFEQGYPEGQPSNFEGSSEVPFANGRGMQPQRM